MVSSTLEAPSIDRRALEPQIKTRVLVENGNPAPKVDIVIIGDGYTEAEANKYWADAERATGYLFSTSPLAENKSSFNVRAVFLPSQESGISSPLEGIWKRSVLGAEYNAHGVERELGRPATPSEQLGEHTPWKPPSSCDSGSQYLEWLRDRYQFARRRKALPGRRAKSPASISLQGS
jgi:hypothetical protein